MKTKPKSKLLQLVDIICKITSVLACLLFILISNSKIFNYFKVREKSRQNHEGILNLKEIQIPELGQKYLKSCI